MKIISKANANIDFKFLVVDCVSLWQFLEILLLLVFVILALHSLLVNLGNNAQILSMMKTREVPGPM